MHGRTRRSAALGVLLAAGLIASVSTAATAAGHPTNISVGNNPIAVEISPDGTRAYVTNASDRTVSVINTASKTVTGTINVGQNPGAIAFTPDSRTAYVANYGDSNTDWGSIAVIDTATSSVLKTVSVEPLRLPDAIAIAPNGAKAYVVGFNFLSVIDTATNVSHSVDIGRSHATDVQVSPDGSRVYITDWDSQKIVVVSTATERVITTVPLGTTLNQLTVTPDGKRLYATSMQNNKVHVVNTADYAVVASVDVPGGPLGISTAPNGRDIFVTGYEGHTLVTLNGDTNTISQTGVSGRHPRSVAITPNGFLAYALMTASPFVSVVDIADANEPGRDRLVRGESLTAGQSRTSPDGKLQLVMQTDGNLVLYTVATGQALWSTNTHGTGVVRATLQYDGNLVLYTAADAPRWATNTWGTAADRLILQSDANLVLYSANATAHWARR